jgi:hypothetical protein
MTKNKENVITSQKMTFCCLKKTMMRREIQLVFFTNSVRVVRSLIPESFSLAADSYRKRGRFLVELPRELRHHII